MVKNIAIGAGGLGFDSRIGQIEHSVANGSPSPRRLIGAVLYSRRPVAEMAAATRDTLRRDAASAKKIFFVLEVGRLGSILSRVKPKTLKLVSAVTLVKRSAFKCGAEDEMNRE